MIDQNQFEESWKRVEKLTGWKKQKELADFLGISGSSVSGTKSRGNFPLEWAYKIAAAFYGSTDWILDGRGQMRPGEEIPEQHPGRVKQLEEPVITELKLWLNEQRGEESDIYIWFKVELQMKFPKFKDWLEKKRGADSILKTG